VGFVAHLGPSLRAKHGEAPGERGGQDRADEGMPATLERDQGRQRVAIAQRASQLLDARMHGVGFAEHPDRQVQQVNARRGHGASGRLLARQAPVVLAQLQELVLAEVRLHLQRRAQGTGLEQTHELENGRLESLLMSHRQGDAGGFHGRDGFQDVGTRHGQRLFAEDVPARARRAEDLLGVLGVRGAQNNALHRGVLQGFVQAGGEADATFESKGTACFADIDDMNDLELLTRGEKVDDDTAPPAEANHSNVQHGSADPVANAVDDALGRDHLGVFDDLHAVGHVGRDVHRLARADLEDLAIQRDAAASGQDDGNLLVRMRVQLRALARLVLEHADFNVRAGDELSKRTGVLWGDELVLDILQCDVCHVMSPDVN
jgi:hypothetical protein